IKIDMVRDLKKSFSLPPIMALARVVLIPEAHTLNQAAANALLKTLEEPPPATYFILGTHAPGWVPKTILSRCQKVRFSPLSRDELQEILQAQGQKPDFHRLAWSQGSAHLALQGQEVPSEFPSLAQLVERNDTFGLTEAYTLAQTLSEGEALLPCLERLL